MTLAEIIAAHEARQPDPIVLTPLGRAAATARRLARVLPELDHGARIAVTNVVLAELARLRAEEPELTA